MVTLSIATHCRALQVVMHLCSAQQPQSWFQGLSTSYQLQLAVRSQVAYH